MLSLNSFSVSLVPHIDLKNKKVLLLGNGGTSKTARTVLKDLQAREIVIVDINKDENVDFDEICG
mgnify:CR=1 FL=1